MRAKFEAVVPHLNERQRRLLYGAEARQLGHGGIAAIAAAAGVSKGCVSRGLADPEEDAEPDGRVRRPGGGRPDATEKDPGLRAALLDMVENSTQGDPIGPLAWAQLGLRVGGLLSDSGVASLTVLVNCVCSLGSMFSLVRRMTVSSRDPGQVMSR